MKTNKVRALLAAMGLGLAIVGTSAMGAVTIVPNDVTAFQDDDLDFVFDSAGNPKGTTGTLAVGDRLVSVIEVFETFGQNTGVGPFPITPDELTGLATATITSITDANGDGIAEQIVFDSTVSLFLHNAPDLTIVPPNCANFAACQAAAINGTPWATAEEVFWTAQNAQLDIAGAAATGASTTIAFINFGLNLTSGPPLPAGTEVVKQDCNGPAAGGEADVCGSGNILGGSGLVNGAFARSDFDFQIATRTVQNPEPATMVLLALGLLGLGATLRSRKD